MMKISDVFQTPHEDNSKVDAQKPPQQIINFNQHVHGAQPETARTGTTPAWNARAIAHLDNYERRLDDKIPNSTLQNKIDQMGRALEQKFAPLKKFNDWLNTNEMGSWYRQLAMFLVKLPMRAVRNTIRLLYTIIKGIFYAVTHPLKACIKLAKLIIRLAHELSKPETWTKMGAGALGASAGQAVISGNPLSLIGMGIGAAMIAGGLIAGVVKTALDAEKGERAHAIKEHLLFQIKALPESALTGFILGLIMGGIERAITPTYPSPARVNDYVKGIIRENRLPPDTAWSFNPSTGKITIDVPWTGRLPELAKTHPDIFGSSTRDMGIWYEGAKIEILPHSTNIMAKCKGVTAWDYIEHYNLDHPLPIHVFGKLPQGYPSTLSPPPSTSLAIATPTASGFQEATRPRP